MSRGGNISHNRCCVGELDFVAGIFFFGAAIEELQSRFPGIAERLVDEKGEVRRFVNVYVNEEDIRFLKNKETPLKDGDEISIIPAIAGG